MPWAGMMIVSRGASYTGGAYVTQTVVLVLQCSVTCGEGLSHREVYCTHQNGRHHSIKHCGSRHRPVARRPCRSKPCYSTSCNELRSRSSIETDGEYRLLIRGRLLQVGVTFWYIYSGLYLSIDCRQLCNLLCCGHCTLSLIDL